MAENEELSKLEELAMNISDSSEEEDSEDDSDKDEVAGVATVAGEKEIEKTSESSKDLERLEGGRLEKLAVQKADLIEDERESDEINDENLESSKDLERLETGMLEKLAMEISDSEEEDMSDDNSDNARAAIEASKPTETAIEAPRSTGTGVAGLIEQIENAAHTSTIVLDREESQEQYDEGHENYVTNVDSLEDLRPGDVFDVELNQSQLEYLGEATQNDDDLVDQIENDNETNADEEDEEEDEEAESESSSDEEMPKTFESASELCDNYLDHLNHMLTYLVRELERNLARQEEIDTQVFELHQEQTIRSHIVRSQHVSVSKKTLTVFGYPYFKDKNLFHPPENSDTKVKKSKKELDPWVENPRPFTKQDKINLKQYVKEDAIRKKLMPLEAEKDALTEKLRQTALADREELENRLAAVLRRMWEAKRTPEEELFYDRFYSNFDWDRISVTNFNSAHTPRECQLQWRNLVHPDINRGVWCPEEDHMLKKLAEATGGQDWDGIARELGTARTPIACFVRYMTRHCVAVNNRKWERQEDDRLRRLVAQCRINDFIPWAKVSFYMDRRTKEQCYQRYVYSLKDSIRHGPFTDAEDMLLIIGKELYGKDWSKISEMTPCRTPVQLHCRWNSFLRCEFRAWTPEEDNRLLELVRQHGIKDWVTVAHQLGGHRTRGQVRQRFQQIYQTFKRDPSANLQNMKYSEDAGIAKKRQDQIFDKLSSCYAQWRQELAGKEQSPTVAIGRFASSGHIMLRDGEMVSNRDLSSFIRHIQSFLPKPPLPKPLAPLLKRSLRGLPDREEEVFAKPLLSKVKNMPSKTRKPVTGSWARGRKRKSYCTTPSFRVISKVPRKKRKVNKVSFHAVASVDMAIAKFFKPCWLIKRKPANHLYSEEEINRLSQAASALGKALDLSGLKWEKRNESMMDELEPRERQLVDKFQEDLVQPGNDRREETMEPVALPRPAVQRTYSRRGRGQQVKQSLSRSQTPVTAVPTPLPCPSDKEVVSLLPPSRASLIALRGLELKANSLRAKACGTRLHLPEESVSVPEAGQRLNPAQAEERLINRCVRLFYWPAKMAGTPPPRQENLFDDSDGEAEAPKVIPRASRLRPGEPRGSKVESDGEVEVWAGKVNQATATSIAMAANQEMRDPLEVALPTIQKKEVVQGKGLHGIARPRTVQTD